MINLLTYLIKLYKAFLLKPNAVLSSKLGLLSSINVFFGFLFQWYIIRVIGPGDQTDALFTGMVLPQLILMVTTGSLTYVLVPILTVKKGSVFNKEAWSFFLGIFLLLILFTAIIFITSAYWVKLLAPGFDLPKTILTTKLLRIQSLGMIFTGLSSVLFAVNNAKNLFLNVEKTIIVSNVLSFIIILVALENYGIFLAAWATVFKFFMQTILLIPALGRYQKIDLRSDSIAIAWKRIRPLLLGTLYYKSDNVVDRYLASMSYSGGITLLHLAIQIYNAGKTVLSKAITTPMVTQLSHLTVQNDVSAFKLVVKKRLLLMTVITIFVTAGIFLFGKFGLAVIFANESFNFDDVNKLWGILLALSLMWICGATGQILSSSFYAMGETIIPTRIGVFGFTLSIVFKVAGYYYFGIIGIALGTSLYYLLNMILLSVFLTKKLNA